MLDSANGLVRCRSWNVDGKRLFPFCSVDDPINEPFPPDSDVFVPYGGPVSHLGASDLKIDVQHTARQFVWLENGVVLLPGRADCEFLKKFIDELRMARSK